MKIPAGHLEWGLITDPADLEYNSISLKELTKIKGALRAATCYLKLMGQCLQ